MTDLLPCPFCGGSAEVCFHQATGVAWVRCVDCDTSTGASIDLNKAIEFWNGRYKNRSLFISGKCVYKSGAMFSFRVLALDEDDFYYQLFKMYHSAIVKYKEHDLISDELLYVELD